jgi:hypothetical protein
MSPNASQNSRVLVQLRDMILKGNLAPVSDWQKFRCLNA